MDIAPFPPQDLAKLVLGYLAEEELMTAYDEFLQASPYLDAYMNEYDRIFMTSLRNILADYRAVKIYVETCKPHALRRKLLQCLNLSEMIKYLISVIDPMKLPKFDHPDKTSISKNHVTKPNCETCTLLNSKSCVCNEMPPNIHHLNEKINVSCPPKATSLVDLPGNTINRKKVDSFEESKRISKEQSGGNTLFCDSTLSSTSDHQLGISHTSNANILTRNEKIEIDTGSIINSRHKVEDSNSLLSLVNNKDVTSVNLCNNLILNQVQATASPYQVPDYGSQHKVTRVDANSVPFYIPIAPKSKESGINVSTVEPHNNLNINSPLSSKNLKSKNEITMIENKSTDNKIKILSNVRFDNCFSCNPPTSLPPVLKGNATSTPFNYVKRLVINGTPGFIQKNDSNVHTYSKDEIMAMPTVIIVPTSGSNYNSVSESKISNETKINIPATTTTVTVSTCEPLFVDVSSSMPSLTIDDDNKKVPNSNTSEVGLVKTVDSVPHTSVPKNSTFCNNPSTPHVLPPKRLSSSTPRRSTHIRVLDFATPTPRRILEKTVPEKDPIADDAVVVISDSPVACEKSSNVNKSDLKMLGKNLETELKKDKPVKRSWDQELRALVEQNQDLFPPNSPKPKIRVKKDKKQSQGQDKDQRKLSKKDTSKLKSKKKGKTTEQDSKTEKKIDKPIKPLINIISGDQVTHSEGESEQIMNKQSDEHQFDTPEVERLSLQNEIGGKLNISDLLETPYKQAIYDIQMETPRFLGPDLPGEPVSDIKIMNIPTPKFFDDPIQNEATPSTYSSRPTDYSSGGSYYKPDDQDYHIPELNQYSNNEVKITHKKLPPSEIKRNNDSAPESSSISKTRETKKPDRPAKNKCIPTKTVKYRSPLKRDSTKTFMKIKPRRVTPVKDALKNRKIQSDCNQSGRKKILNHISPVGVSVPTKSRRKSSTPRKLHCSKIIHSSTSSNTSPDIPEKITSTVSKCEKITCDSENNQVRLRWSVDGSYDLKQNDSENLVKESDDSIIKRGLDVETARIIERDLLDTPPLQDTVVQSTSNEMIEETIVERVANPDLKNYQNNTSDRPKDQNLDDNKDNDSTEDFEDDDDDVVFSVQESNEDTGNYFVCDFNETLFKPKDIVPLKDKFCMEVCIDDGVSLRLRSTALKELFQLNESEAQYDRKEIDSAVSSISNIDKLYTPIKDHRAQCYEIFDSTLTSLDTPLKETSPKIQEKEMSVVLEVENLSNKPDTKKRKRVQSGASDEGSIKKSKKDEYLLHPANIQNIDIESVLSKLHGS
ncbi:unnamed protein product [Leptosia nina]|uniref:LisH domain-containing protein n=1 Tax=Leptosia nina TaxID=320188 RepID=A0AAV1J9I3_9NEOP